MRARHVCVCVHLCVQKLFKEAKVTIGPWIDKGFYYDFDSPVAFQDKDLRKIKKEMDKIIQMKLPLVREEVSSARCKRVGLPLPEGPVSLSYVRGCVSRPCLHVSCFLVTSPVQLHRCR